jgi:nucleoid-associated protein YgaU
VRTVVAGDSLASIAYREYGDPTMWRPLAAFNGIDDPLRAAAGRDPACCHRRRPHGGV